RHGLFHFMHAAQQRDMPLFVDIDAHAEIDLVRPGIRQIGFGQAQDRIAGGHFNRGKVGHVGYSTDGMKTGTSMTVADSMFRSAMARNTSCPAAVSRQCARPRRVVCEPGERLGPSATAPENASPEHPVRGKPQGLPAEWMCMSGRCPDLLTVPPANSRL